MCDYQQVDALTDECNRALHAKAAHSRFLKTIYSSIYYF